MNGKRTAVLCKKCGEPSAGKRYCARCVELRLGVIVQRDQIDRSLSSGWRTLGDGGYMRVRAAAH